MDPITATSLAAGLFGGIGATVAWEAFLRPVRERLHIAEVLASEVSLNMQLLAGAHVSARPDKVPTDFELSTAVFDSVVDRVGQLPPSVVGKVLLLYRFFRRLNDLPKTYEQYVDDLRRTPANAPHHEAMRSEVQQCIDVFNGHVVKAIEKINAVQPALLACAFPWWSSRRWFAVPSRELTTEEVAANVERARQERLALAQSLQGRSRPQTG